MTDPTTNHDDQHEETSAYDAFRKKVRFFRQQAGMSQQALATQMGVSVSTISEMERGSKVRIPKQPFVYTMDRVLGADGALMEAAGYAVRDVATGDRYDPTESVGHQEFRAIFRDAFREADRRFAELESENDRLRRKLGEDEQ